jgi:peptide deformylase
MAIRKIITTENPILRQKAKKVHRFDASLRKLLDDMFETLHSANGVGLAAPQIALSIRVFVAEYEDHKVAIFNPEIVKAEGEVLGTEACLSIPGYFGDNIRRAEKIVVKGQDVKGKAIRVPAEGWFARILQHEIDHLDGILFLDRLDRPEDLHETSELEEEEELEGASSASSSGDAEIAAPEKEAEEATS